MPRMSSEKEHDAFQSIINGVGIAQSGMMDMSRLRPDQQHQWEKAAAMMKVLEGQLYDLATGGMFTAEDGKWSGGRLM